MVTNIISIYSLRGSTGNFDAAAPSPHCSPPRTGASP
jgi:hypothetical protein